MTETAAPDHSTFPMRRKCPFDPPPQYDRLRAEEPVSRVRLRDGAPAWVVTRYEDVRAVLTSPAFSADASRPGYPGGDPAAQAVFEHRPFLRMDPPEHTFHRRMLIQEFTVKRIKELRPGIQAAVDNLLDDLLRRTPPVDLVESFALPLPSLVICQLLGVPYADHESFQNRSRVLLSRDSTPEQAGAAMVWLRDYLDRLITAKQHNPTDDLTSRLVTTQLEPAGELRRGELVTTCVLLLIAGHETTSNVLALGTMALLEHPDQLAALKADPGLLPSAVEELLRYLSIADFITARVAVQDAEVGGTTIRAGEAVIALLAAADWDPAVFVDPATFDLHRGNRHHVAFGYGVHQCLGQNLARAEMEIAFETLFRRIPTLRVATPLDQLPYKHDSMLHGVHELPVTWGKW